MAAPQNSQGFVQPSSGGVGNWLGKFFGGISQEKRARSAAQLQLDLHAGKADVDTFHRKERTTWDMATKDAGAELAYDRAGREIDRGIDVAPAMGRVGLKGFDSAGRPDMQATGQRPKEDKATPTPDKVDTPPDNTPPPNNTPPPDRAANTKRSSKPRNATLKDTMAALSAGHIDKEQAAEMSPTYARNLGKKTASESVATIIPARSAGRFNPLSDAEGAEYNKRAGITGDGAAPAANTPAVVPDKPRKPRKPRTPKAGA